MLRRNRSHNAPSEASSGLRNLPKDKSSDVLKTSDGARPSKIRRIFRFLAKAFLWGFFISLFYVLITKWVNPPITITQTVSLLKGYGLKRDYVKMKNISRNMKLAVLASEDQLFPDHNGFDFKSMEKAWKHNQKSKSMRGASTISQQVAKNVFLWQGGGYFRKGLEVYFTFMIENVWGKRRILETYLNVAEMGKGVFGVEAAARKYFGKSAANLTRSEASQIAASLPNPRKYSVKPLSSYVAFRSQWIMRQMNQIEGDPDIQAVIR